MKFVTFNDVNTTCIDLARVVYFTHVATAGSEAITLYLEFLDNASAGSEALYSYVLDYNTGTPATGDEDYRYDLQRLRAKLEVDVLPAPVDQDA